jgi:GTP-binding protein Era
MNKAAATSILDVEFVLFVVEGTRWHEDDQMVLNKLIASNKPVILVVNKVDLYKDKAELLPHLQWLGSQLDFLDVVPLSAESGDNVSALRKVVQQHLPPCEFLFPDDYVTDRSQRFMAAEIVREKLMRFLGDELPYAVTVEIERFKWEEKHFHIAALVLVERESQKRMVIGNKGERLKQIATEARLDMAAMLEAPVFLQIWVKVKTGWADDERALRSLGYGED